MDTYELWLGTFEGENFVWKTIKKFDDFSTGYKYYKDFVKKQFAYTDEELLKEWGSARLDIELRKGKKRLEWAGIYSNTVTRDDEKKVKEETK